jgi:hypothetical protein
VITQIAVDLGISESRLRNWLRQDDVDDDVTEVLSTAERAERAMRRSLCWR